MPLSFRLGTSDSVDRKTSNGDQPSDPPEALRNERDRESVSGFRSCTPLAGHSVHDRSPSWHGPKKSYSQLAEGTGCFDLSPRDAVNLRVARVVRSLARENLLPGNLEPESFHLEQSLGIASRVIDRMMRVTCLPQVLEVHEHIFHQPFI